jgi:hypothetical protein
MQRVREVELQLDVEDVPKDAAQLEFKVTPAPKQDTLNELLWISELRERINQALHIPEIPIEQLQIRDEKFRDLVKKEKETERKVK